MRGPVLAAIQQPRAAAANLGPGAAGGSQPHLRQHLLVACDVLQRGLQRDAAADVSGGWEEDSGYLDGASGPARAVAASLRAVSAVQVLGAGDVHRINSLDRKGGDCGR